uniref:Secreted protein n=1 Tax=Sipha flava TaxID=143950 RepID=A0A2S2PV61_9HEMI
MTTSVVALVVTVGTLVTLVRSAAVVDNVKRPITLNSEEFSSISGSECDDGRVANCRTLPLFNYTELAPPPVDAEAADDILQDPNCPYKYLERHLRCVDIFTRRCLTKDQRRAFYSLYSVPTMDLQELCNEGSPYRDEYRKHAVCLHTVHTEYVKCGQRHKHELASLMVDHGPYQYQNGNNGSQLTSVPFAGVEQITQNLAHLCRSFRGHLQCVNGIVRAKCGAETEEFANRFLSQMASSLLNICDTYGDLKDGDVSGSPSSVGTGSLRITTTAAAVLLVVAFRITR